MNEIPVRVTPHPNGFYIWSAELDMNEVRKGYKTGGIIWAEIAAVIFLSGIFFSLRSHDWRPFLYVSGFVIVIVLITFGVVHGQENMGQRRQTYRLMDELIATGSGRRTAVFEFKKAKKMIVGERYIELRGTMSGFRLYVPEEDFDFVRDYIRKRVPVECEMSQGSRFLDSRG